MKIGCIVEGHGEVEAVPILLRRFAGKLDPPRFIEIPVTLRVSRQKIVKEGEIERSVELVARKLGGDGAIFVLLDADDDLPCALGPALLSRARQARPDMPIGVVLAKQAFEAWFLAAIGSLTGCRDLTCEIDGYPNPEQLSNHEAKRELGRRMGRSYSETLDQPAFTAVLDLEAARRAASFDKCYREIARLLHDAQRPAPPDR